MEDKDFQRDIPPQTYFEVASGEEENNLLELLGPFESQKKTVTLGELVKAAREKLEMNQKELAEKTGITQATISRIESGQVKDPKLDALKRIAKALNLPINYLFGIRKPTNDLAEILLLVPEAKFLIKSYVHLSRKGKDQLINFTRYLVNEQKTEESQNRD